MVLKWYLVMGERIVTLQIAFAINSDCMGAWCCTHGRLDSRLVSLVLLLLLLLLSLSVRNARHETSQDLRMSTFAKVPPHASGLNEQQNKHQNIGTSIHPPSPPMHIDTHPV